jgi:peptidoglycan/xylan/chitin deacetylase (PgdA/CDA1 family)
MHTFHWYKHQPPLLSWNDIVALDRASPLTFEPHSISHPNLMTLPDHEAEREIAGSKEVLEARLGRPTSVFCYPVGLFTAREHALVAGAGYRYAVSCESGVNLPRTDPFALRRTQILGHDSLLDFRAKIDGAHDAPLLLRDLYRRWRYGFKLSEPE